MSKRYDPCENGSTERLNGTMAAMLRRSTIITTEWDVRLPFCMMAYTMTPHRSKSESPYFILHRIDPKSSPTTIPNGGVTVYSTDEYVGDRKSQLL